MPYISTKDVAAIRKELNAFAKGKAKLSVRKNNNSSGVEITVVQSDLFAEGAEIYVNTFYINENYKDNNDQREFLSGLVAIAEKSQREVVFDSDYGSVPNYYVELSVGRWDKKHTRYTPEVEQPEVEQPEVEQPEVEQPEVEQPEVEQPEVEQPEVEQPEVDFEKYKAMKQQHTIRVAKTKKRWYSFIKRNRQGVSGSLPESVKQSKEYLRLRDAYDKAMYDRDAFLGQFDAEVLQNWDYRISKSK